MSFVRLFSQLGLADRLLVGGKGANLGELTGAGIRVPPGFVVTTDAFIAFLETLDAESIRTQIESLEAADLDTIQKTGARIRAQLESAPIPGTIATAIAGSLATLAGEETHVAVRSSATSEDGEDASFAGLQDTYLWRRGTDDVVHHVRACWASLYSTESVTYRRRLNMREEGLAMGVVVQQMVDSRASGVMFTRSPATGDRSVIVIEGSYGLGSAIVSGEVTPDKYVISKVSGDIANRAVSQKTMQHVPKADGGVDEIEVPAAKQLLPCLTDDEILALAALGKQVERHYGRPQDIEWAIAKDGTLYLLQSRPETVWAKRDGAPIAAPKASGMDHVFAVLGGRRS